MGLYTSLPQKVESASSEQQSSSPVVSVSPEETDEETDGVKVRVEDWLKKNFNFQDGEFNLNILDNSIFSITLPEVKAGDQIKVSQGQPNFTFPDKPQAYGFIKEGEEKVVLFPNVLTPYGRFYVEGVDIEKGEVVYRSESGIEISVGINNMSEESIAEVLVNSINTQISEGQLVVVRSDASQELPDFYQIESPIPTGGSETSVFLFFNSIQNNLILSFGDGKSVVINLPDDLADKFKTTATNTEFVVDESGNLVGKGLPEGVSLRLQEGYPVLSYQKTTVLGRVQEGGLNVRSGPGTNFSKVGSLSGGTEIQVFHGSTLIVPGEGEYMLGLRDRRDESGKLTYEIVLQKTDAQGEIIEEKSLSEASAIPDLWAKIVYNGGEGYVAVRYNGSELVKLGATGVEEKIEIAPSADLLPAPDFENAQLKAAVSDFVNAMEMVGIEISAEQVNNNLKFRKIMGVDGKEYVVGSYTVTDQAGTPYSVAIKAERNERGEWRWSEIYTRELTDILGKYFGVFVDPRYNAPTPMISHNFNLVTPGAFSWNWVRRKGRDINRIDLSLAEEWIRFAEKNEMLVMNGNPLVYHHGLPDWLTSGNFSKEELTQIMIEHIDTIVRQFKGSGVKWVVLNEAVWNHQGHSGYENSIWYKIIGEGYVELAFRAARQADPSAILIYNDFTNKTAGQGAEISGPKADTVFNLVKRLKQEGLVDEVGIQMHVFDPNSFPSEEEIIAQIKRYEEIGVPVNFTEVDVSIKPLLDRGIPIQDALKKQAKVYHTIIEACLRSNNCKGVNIWGLKDNESWLGENSYSLLFSSNRPKPAFYSVVSALLSEFITLSSHE